MSSLSTSAFNGRSLRTAAVAQRQQAVRTNVRTAIVARAKEAGCGIMGTKAGMTTVFTEDGLALACTVLALEDGNVVTQVKTTESHGYNSVQVAYQPMKEKNVKKPMAGHFKKAGVPPMRHVCEFRLNDTEGFEVGQQLDIAEMFPEGAVVDVAGTTVGKGFQGSIKRWGMARGLMSHGSKSHRQHGSIGGGHAGEGGRVLPGLKMAGQMGNVRRKVKQLKVVKVDLDKRALVVKGSVPGKPGNVLTVTPAKIVGTNC